MMNLHELLKHTTCNVRVITRSEEKPFQTIFEGNDDEVWEWTIDNKEENEKLTVRWLDTRNEILIICVEV